MNRLIPPLIYYLVFFHASFAFSQQVKFNRVLDGSVNNWRGIKNIVQDKQGYLWFNTYNNGFYKYDGSAYEAFTHNPNNKNSVSSNATSCLAIDQTGNIWVGTFNSGISKYDPVKKTFTHFRHDPKNISSLVCDTIFSVIVDRLNNIWIGTSTGVSQLDTKTGKFINYKYDEKNEASLSYNVVSTIYEDHEGIIWIGCVNTLRGGFKKHENGGLNRLDRSKGEFTRYKNIPSDTNSLIDNNVTAIYEDSKGNFW